MKILPDTHLGRTFTNNVPLHRRGERERTLWEKFEQELDPQGETLHVHVGDLFDKAIVSYDVLFKAAELYRRAALAHPKTTFVVLRGNHDASRDLEHRSAFDLFIEMTCWVENIVVLREPMILGDMAFFPWSPITSAEEMVRSVTGTGDSIAFGHWDTDLRSDPFNLIPTKVLAERGFTKAYTGHVHLAQKFQRDDVDVDVVGSLIPFAHGEDPTGETYVTLSLDEARAAGDLHNKCVRIRLQPGEIYDLTIDCLQLQVERADVCEEPLDVSLGDFDLHKLFDDVLAEHAVPSFIASQVRSEWDRIFTLRR